MDKTHVPTNAADKTYVTTDEQMTRLMLLQTSRGHGSLHHSLAVDKTDVIRA